MMAMGPEKLDDERLSWIRARWCSARGKDMSAHYVVDVGDLLDEVDRLRYELTRKSSGKKKKAVRKSAPAKKKARKKSAGRSP